MPFNPSPVLGHHQPTSEDQGGSQKGINDHFLKHIKPQKLESAKQNKHDEIQEVSEYRWGDCSSHRKRKAEAKSKCKQAVNPRAKKALDNQSKKISKENGESKRKPRG